MPKKDTINALDLALMTDPEVAQELFFRVDAPDSGALARAISVLGPRKKAIRAYIRANHNGFDWESRVGYVGRALNMPMQRGPDGLCRSRFT